jgi:hypothetical protein
VDDIVYGGPSDTRRWFKEKIEQRFKIKDLGRLSKHLGTWYEKSKDEKGESCYKLSMKKYQEELVSDYEEVMDASAKEAKTPAFPGESLVRDTNEDIVDLDNFCKILGKAMWFCKRITPECCNAIRE